MIKDSQIISLFFLKLQFEPSNFRFIKEQFGELRIEKKVKSWLDCSLVLTKEEAVTLSQMTESKDGILLYRATTDGFEAKAFHAKCDGKENTITIIKTNGNYVFGGYSAAKWNSNGTDISDAKAFIFSLRRNGISCNHKFRIKDVKYSIYGHPSYGPTFGDIVIKDKSNINIGSYSNLGRSYHYPPENVDKESFLAGSENKWLTTEIEVYQINK